MIHCFVPVIVQPSPSASARVRSAPASEPDLRLGQREGADLLAARERGHEALALLLGAEREYRQGAGARMHCDRDADTGIRARKLLEDEDVREEVGTGAAELLGHADAHQPELGELFVQLGGEAVLAIPVAAFGSISACATSRASAWISRWSAESWKFIGRDATC